MKEFIHNAKRLLLLAVPIMLGSAGQNVIALTDSLFLYGYDEKDFAAVGFVSVFYLVISSIAYGFSKGGQIIIARKYGERSPTAVKKYFYAILFFELVVGLFIFIILKFFSTDILSLFVKSQVILQKSLEFIEYRIYGLVFAYVGLAFLSLYMGIGRPKIILIDTVFLGLTNILLCYLLVYGKAGFPEMGIAGAGLASSLAEIAAFVFFLVYILLDKDLKPFDLFSIPHIEPAELRNIYKLSLPILMQSVIGIASWFIFFSFIEKLGERALAISNLLRVVYLIFTIPCWGFAAAINTMVSKTIGRKREQRVLKQVYHSSLISLAVTTIVSFPFLIFAQTLMYPFLGGGDTALFQESLPYFKILFAILMVASFSNIFFNGVSGAGETSKGLNIQIIGSLLYLGITWVAILYPETLGLKWAWYGEIVYWLSQCLLSWWVLKSGKWYFIKF
ncbi:MAG: MATE family efflux transporter [Saprospiraceae bacterium]|nr:MATE family efflux transporter [Candidatus Vicinibacter proximus]MBL7823775.1 MATE family efflux transporter [Saprospiraceae bacterium]MCC6841780.1 MATE family efflux transporter [Saprospiraceae bacterium]HRG32943.1 MATE family efflux transporter [Saprospiraceae bacterium]